MRTSDAERTSSSLELSALADALRSWWMEEVQDWDAAVVGADAQSLPGGDDLWDDLPKVDSKAIARSSPIFVRYLGVPLDVSFIRPGGYASIDDAIADLVPKMAELAARKSQNG
jgi:hypothetical protein